VFVNLATDIAQTAGARLFETPLLKGLHPTTVVALLGLGDVELSVDPSVFGHDLAGVLVDARRAGAQRILVATLPDDGYPQVARYNAQIRSVVATAGVTLVDLAPLTVSGAVLLRPPTLSVFVPDDKGERTIADAFTRVYRATFPNG
jgi:hypothetical protein